MHGTNGKEYFINEECGHKVKTVRCTIHCKSQFSFYQIITKSLLPGEKAHALVRMIILNLLY